MAVLVSTDRLPAFACPAIAVDKRVNDPWCAGCSIADELFTSFEQLLTLADRKGVKYDR